MFNQVIKQAQKKFAIYHLAHYLCRSSFYIVLSRKAEGNGPMKP
jgi:hypothetical protein